ncbi:hypothetical protein, partial [Aerosakkonema funiforme]|uniref:hypothetical protein n=1 Tax=Aerosakkonema funiforme TaxID=1246630 RepID=UPI001A7E46F2
LVGKPLNVSRVVERGNLNSDVWNPRAFTPGRMSKISRIRAIALINSLPQPNLRLLPLASPERGVGGRGQPAQQALT